MTSIHLTNQTTQDTQESKENQAPILSVRSPQSALFKTEEGFELTIDLPGANADDVHVEMKGHRLYLQAPTDQGFEYQRTYTFKSSFLWGDFEAKWTSGRLKLVLPIQKPLGRTIPIQSA